MFRDTLDALGLQYAVEIQSTTMVQTVHDNGALADRMSVMEFGEMLECKLRRVTWREGSKTTLHSRFARIRVVVARDDGLTREPEWLLVEWPEGEASPTKFALSSLPASISCVQLVRTFKSRWRIERSYEDLKGELGLDHYEGRSWVGWHHHVSAVLACYAFLVAEQVRSFPPSFTWTSDYGPFEHTTRATLPRFAHHRPNPVRPHGSPTLAPALPVLPAFVHARDESRDAASALER
jgi:SRSO17 transposase